MTPDEKKTAIRRLGISADVFEDLYADFVTLAQECALLMKAAGDSCDWHRMGRLAHSVKGMAANLGVTSVFEAANAVESEVMAPAQSAFLLAKADLLLREIGLL